jgi:putative DNA primase/helicase
VTLRDWWGNDGDSIRLLRQWMGYNLIATNYLEAMMIMFGVSGSGKSTITKILHGMLGPDKSTVLEFQDLKYTFGMEKIANKNTIIFSEDQATKKADADVILAAIKRLTGRNIISVRVKFGGTYDTEPFARLTYECDTLPRFVDNAQALERRVNMLYFDRSFNDAPNPLLKDQLMQEIPGITNWALEGLRDLRQTNKFIEPKVSKIAKEELRYMTSPLAALGKQCLCFDDPNAFVLNDQLFDLHRTWFKENGYALYSRVWFGRTFSVVFPRLKKSTHGTIRGYKGVSILPEAATRYLESPV